MTTGQDIHNRLAIAVKTEGDTLIALNVAIDASWPAFKLTEYAPAALTLESGVFEYSLASLTLLERGLGVGRVYITTSSLEPEMLCRQVRQRYDHSTGAWTLIFAPSVVAAWSGKEVHVEYQHRHPPISALSDTIHLPPDYAKHAVTAWYAEKMMSELHTDTPHIWRELWAVSRESAKRALLGNVSPTLSTVATGEDRMT